MPHSGSAGRDAKTIQHETAFCAAVTSLLLLLQKASAKRVPSVLRVAPWLIGLGTIGWRLTVGTPTQPPPATQLAPVAVPLS